MKKQGILIGLLGCSLGVSLGQTAAQAQTENLEALYEISSEDFPRPPVTEIIMQSFADVGQGTKLNKGEIVERKYWPGVLDTQNCTASLVSPTVILTAAHCVDAEDPDDLGRTLGATLNWFGTLIPLTCEMNPAYAAAPVNPGRLRNLHDEALCHVRGLTPSRDLADGSILTGKLYEVISVAESRASAGADVTLSGYGCYDVRPFQRLSSSRQDVYYDVNFKIDASYDRDRRLRVGSDRLEPYTGITLQTRAFGTSLEPSLCPGDSGGPIFSGVSPSQPTDDTERYILGVNSTVRLVSYYSRTQPTGNRYRWPVDYQYRSDFVALSNAKFIDFMEDWATRNKAKICLDGYTGGKDIVSSHAECRNSP